MNYPLLKSLLSLGTIILACSCSDDKSPSNNGGSDPIVPCEDAWYLPEQGLLAYQDLRVTDLSGNQVGTLVPVPGTTIAIVKDFAGNNLVNQMDLSKTTVITGDPSKCNTNPKPDASISSCLDAWYLVANSKKYLLYADQTVTDEAGTQVGVFITTTGSSIVNVVDMSGMPISSNIDLNTLPIVPGNGVRFKIIQPAYHLKDATGDYLIYENTVVTLPDGTPIGYANFTTGAIMALDNVTPITAANLLALPILLPGGKCVDYVPPVVSSSSQQPVLSSSSTPPKPVSSSSSKPKSSSSQPKSSSSAPKSSSSSAPVTGQCPTIKTKGGASGSGWATRYWDCCKPHCSWPEHAGGNYSKQCTNKGKSENTNWGDGSVCSGGSQMTCTSQIPFTIDGCTEMAFAFAAVPAANGGSCGKCFQLTFTGEGHYSSTNANTKKLKGKKLIIMATNIGGDVQQGQFDIMIPGGGVGMFNGCSSMGWGNQGAQYGGLLSECETETNYSAGRYKSCLTEKCNKAFSNDEQAKKGCLFLADWMGAAGNPEHNYVEVECPQVLKDKY